MQQRRAGSYSNLRTQLERDIEEERQALLEDQKLCRRRAHKFSIDTNRRRKALEEKRREEEEKEQRFREEVLQQRKQKFQEATEKFQRAHLPPSQRRRTVHTVHKKPTPRLEDALDQIQGSVLSPTIYFSPTNRYSTNTRTVDSPSSTVLGNSSWFQKQVPLKVDYEKMVQEKVGLNLRNNQFYFKQNLEEAQRLLEDQHLNNLQEFNQQINRLTHSESLSSLDSLEDGEENQTGQVYSGTSSFTTQEDPLSNKSERLQSVKSSLLHAAGEVFARDEHVSNWLQNLDYQNHASIASHEELVKSTFNNSDEHFKNPNQKSNAHIMTEQTSMDINPLCTTAALENTNGSFAQQRKKENGLPQSSSWVSQSPAFEMVSREKLLAAGGPPRRPSNAWASPDPTPRQIEPFCTQEDKSDPLHTPKTTSLHTYQCLETPIVLPSSEGTHLADTYYSVNSTNSLKESKHVKDINAIQIADEVDDINKINVNCHSLTADQIISKMNNNQGSAASGVTSKASILLSYDNQNDRKDQKGNVSTATASSFHANSNLDLSREHNKQRNLTDREDANVLKSILKKDSKYENGYSRTLLISKGISFNNQSTACIRDSVELTKGKAKDSENQKTNKKLRWFDEIDKIMIEDEENGFQNNATGILESQSHYVQTKGYCNNMNLRSMSAGAVNPARSSNYQEYSLKPTHMTTGTGSELATAPVVSTGYHFIKQAWMPSKEEHVATLANNIGSQKNNLIKGKTKLIRRPRSAKAPSDVGYKNRKGTVIRPQSATEANKVINNQGKRIMPHPPPKSIPDNRTGQNLTDTVYPPSQAGHFDAINPAQYVQYSYKDKSESNPSLHNVVHTTNSIIVMPSPPAYSVPAYEALSKTTVTVNTVQTVAQKETLTAPMKRNPLYGENGLRLDRTPTDEEITLLWHGVRNALAQKEYSAGDFRHYDLHYINPYIVQSSRPNLSHVTIDGAGLINNSKSISKMNGFFTPPSSGSRRKQILDSSESKRRALLEQRRYIAGSAGWKPNQHAQNSIHTVQINPFPCAFEPGKTVSGVSDAEEVSESTSQFLLAENLVDTSAAEGEILSAMETMKPSRQSMLHSKAQRLGISALSFEEQKLLHSLDRLNQRLQYVQEAIIRNPSAAGVLQMTSPLNIHQYTSSQPADSTLTAQRHRSMSADNRTRLQREF